jgi:uncharacterized membrane protein
MCVGLLVAVAAVSTGCNNQNSAGGPGAKNSSNKSGTHVGLEDNSFKLSPPMLATRLKQGETKETNIGIKRGKNFDQDVSVKFENVPKGVHIDPASSSIKHGDDEIKITVKADDDAAEGDFTVKVVGHPKTGDDATSEFKLTVSKK